MDAFTPMRTSREGDERLEARLQHVEDELGRLPELVASLVRAQVEPLERQIAELSRTASDLTAANAEEPA